MGDQVQSGKFLEDSDWIGGAENGYGTRKPNIIRARTCRSQNDDRRGIHELAAMMFADAKHIEPNLVGDHNLLQQVLHTLDGAEGEPHRRVGDYCTEAVNADLHRYPSLCSYALCNVWRRPVDAGAHGQ